MKQESSAFRQRSFNGISREDFINLVTERYTLNLYKSSKNMNWENLEKIIIEEKNNTPCLEEAEALGKMKKIVEKYNLSSVSFGKVRITEEALNNFEQSLEQLKMIINCESHQVGANKFNFFLDTENVNYAGYSDQFGSNQKIYLNERLSYDAFAHEWLHAIDNIMATQKGVQEYHLSESNSLHSSNISELLKASYIANKEFIENFKGKCLEDSKTTFSNLIQRYDGLGELINKEELKNFLEDVVNNISNNKDYWSNNKDKIQNTIKKHIRGETVSPIAFFLTEIELVNKVMHEKLDESLFLYYAKKMDDNLKKVNFLEKDDEYSTEKREVFARSFETYVDIRFKELNIPNKISNSQVSHYMPHIDEVKTYINKWEPIIMEIKEALNNLSPKKYNKSGILDRIKDLRKDFTNNTSLALTNNKI